ncbi:hypothetical protein PVAND_007333 [Polypedilum vanderplanki]|uniref:Lipase n=1 Tax=Polypedilum vanderplanki TaxID=319348 RepID=A0A9J6C6W2_POLVA|nr:hypothetical protein PVAND_007333 [Polypedilum vanderplanki]
MKQILTFLIFILLNFKDVQGQPGLLTGKQDDVINLLSLAGFANELHRIETEDGYLLKLHRIFPNKPKNRRGPVLLMHGFLGTSADFIFTGPNIALAYQLLNAGYHVFMGNCRGSKFSMKHKSLDPLSREFWRFSFDEIGLLDLPAIINYVLFLSEKKSLFYVGHNQGATALLVLLSSHPKFNEKIIQAHFLAPIAFMDYPHPILAFNAEDYENSMRVLRKFNFVSMVDFTKTIVDNYCSENIPGGLRLCVRLWEFLFGRNQIETEIDPKLLLDLPAFISPTASVRQFLHFLKIYRTGKFQSYDRDGKGREYKLTNVQIPVYIYHGAEDMIVSRIDVERLKNILAPFIKVYNVIPNLNHYDLLLSKNGKTHLYDDICKAMTNDGLDFFDYVKNIFI